MNQYLFTPVLFLSSFVFAMDRLSLVSETARIDAIARVEGRYLAPFFTSFEQKSVPADALIAQAISQMPNDRIGSMRGEGQLRKKVQDIPVALHKIIGEFKVKTAMNFLHRNEMRLLPGVMHRHSKDLPMDQMLGNAEEALSVFYAGNDFLRGSDDLSALPRSEHRYIMAVCGFWSFFDEGSKFRYHQMMPGQVQTDNIGVWFAQQYENVQATVKSLGKDEFVEILYSDGTIDSMTHPLCRAHLKICSMEQLQLLVDCSEGLKNLNTEQAELFKSLPLDMQKALRSNYDISLSGVERLSNTTIKHSITALKYAGLAAWLGGVVYMCSGSIPEFKVPESKSYRAVIDQGGVRGLAKSVTAIAVPITSFAWSCYWRLCVRSLFAGVSWALAREAYSMSDRIGRSELRYSDVDEYYRTQLSKLTIRGVYGGVALASAIAVLKGFTAKPSSN